MSHGHFPPVGLAAERSSREFRSGAALRAPAVSSCMLVCEEDTCAAEVAASIVNAGIELRTARVLTTDHVAYVLRSRAVIVLVSSQCALKSVTRLTELEIEAPVLVLQRELDDAKRFALLDAGATECHRLPISHPALEKAIARLALEGRRRISASVWSDQTTHQVGHGDAAVKLSPHEYAVLRCLMERNGEAVSASRLRLYTWGAAIPQKSEGQIVTVLVCRLRKKLAVIGLQDAIVSVRGTGYAFRQAESFG